MTFDRDALDPSLIPDGATVYWFDGPDRFPAVFVDPRWPHTFTLLGGRICLSGSTTVQWRNSTLAPASRRHKTGTHANILTIDYRDASCGLGHTDHIAISALDNDRVRVLPLPLFPAAFAAGQATPAGATLARLVPAVAAHLLAADGLPGDYPQQQRLEAEYSRIAAHLAADGAMPDTPLVPPWVRDGARP
jgi:hypothetical protein